jgi:large conductance mechanosensitive channel
MNDLIKEFKEFVAGGNIIELAVAFIMGTLIARVVAALVEFIIMPIIGVIFGEPSFDQVMILTINDSEIRIGSFLTVLIAVLLTALGVFLLVVKPYNRFRKQPPPVEAPPSTELLLTQIRDLLASRR